MIGYEPLIRFYKQILELIFAEYDKQVPKDFPDKKPKEQLEIFISTFCKVLYQKGESDSDTKFSVCSMVGFGARG